MSNQFDDGADVISKKKTKKAPPPKQYKVLLHNDDYTPMDFVVHVLASIFHKTNEDASKIMLEAHKRGKAIAGIYPFSIAETKSAKANLLGKSEGYPFTTSLEQE